MVTGVQLPLQESALSSFGVIPSGGVAGSHGSSVLSSSAAAAPFPILTSNTRGSPSHHVLTGTSQVVHALRGSDMRRSGKGPLPGGTFLGGGGGCFLAGHLHCACWTLC